MESSMSVLSGSTEQTNQAQTVQQDRSAAVLKVAADNSNDNKNVTEDPSRTGTPTSVTGEDDPEEEHGSTVAVAATAASTRSTTTARSNSGIIGPYDVLCGRDKSAFNNIGNRRMRVFLSLYLAQYMEAPDRLAKSEMIETVANTIRQSGGRFLKWSTDTHTYVPLNEKEVHRKCSHAFRDMVAARLASSSKQQQSLERRRQEEENESITVGSPPQEQQQQEPQKPARRPRSLVPFHFYPNTTNNSSTLIRSRVASKQRRASASEVPDAAASPSTKKRPARRAVSWPNVHPPTEPFTHHPYPPAGASSSRETQETRLQYLAPGPNAHWLLEQLEPQQQEQHETDADLAEPNPKKSRSIFPSFQHPDSTATTAAVPSMDNMYNQPLSSTMGTATTTTPTNMLSLSTSSTSEYNAVRNNLAFIPIFGGTEEEERLLFQDLFESDDNEEEEEDQMRQEWGNGGGGGLEDDMESI